MCSIAKLERIADEVEAGIGKLDKREYWISNSHAVSVGLLGIILIISCLLAISIDLYYFFKFKVYWRIRFSRILK